MALEDMKRDTMYPTIRRFIRSNVGKNWNKLYSRICAVAPANTEIGREIRRAVDWEVDVNGPGIHPNDYYVDDRGLLRINPNNRHSWKAHYRQTKDKKPILKIVFAGDGNTLWYEFISVSERWVGTKLMKSDHKEWFQFVRTYIKDSKPIWQGSQIIKWEPYLREEIHRRQCNSKEIKMLTPIVLRRVKVIELVYLHDVPGLTAHVPGKSTK